MKEVELAAARQAFERGDLKRAVPALWTAGRAAYEQNRPEGLQAAVMLAKEIGASGDGRLQRDAATAARYFENCLLDLEAGVLTRRRFAGIFGFGRRQSR